jgi:hypothetical protein
MKKKFTINEDHIKLLRHMITDWDGCEFGAPSIDPKRPYGNSDVYTDIAEILGIVPDDPDDSFSAIQEAYMRCLHEQTQTALQIVLATGQFSAGEYQADEYRRNWEKI